MQCKIGKVAVNGEQWVVDKSKKPPQKLYRWFSQKENADWILTLLESITILVKQPYAGPRIMEFLNTSLTTRFQPSPCIYHHCILDLGGVRNLLSWVPDCSKTRPKGLRSALTQMKAAKVIPFSISFPKRGPKITGKNTRLCLISAGVANCCEVDVHVGMFSTKIPKRKREIKPKHTKVDLQIVGLNTKETKKLTLDSILN